PVVVIEESAQTFATPNSAESTAIIGGNRHMTEALVMSLGIEVLDVVLDAPAESARAEEDRPVEDRLPLDSAGTGRGAPHRLPLRPPCNRRTAPPPIRAR